MKKAERASYEKFIKNDFKGGELKSIMSGKTSYVRNKILGFQTAGLRLTLTIDCTLGPHYISIPQAVYDDINLATPLVVVNRAPSINSKCIYIVEMLRNADPNDSTIHLSSFLTDGLHADQDGDDLTVFYLKTYGGEVPSLTTMGAIIELRKLSWKYGDRHNVAYQPRYSFTQYHYLILHMFDDFFKKYSPLWASLKGSSKLKCKQIMDLGCSIYHKEVDDFVELVLQFTEALNWILVSGQEMLEGLGVVKAVVESGAKGTKEHIETCIKNIRTLPEDYTEKLVVGFNKFIDNSARMSIGGVIQFILLYCLHSIILHQNNVYAKNHILLTNIKESDLAASPQGIVVSENSSSNLIARNLDIAYPSSDRLMMHHLNIKFKAKENTLIKAPSGLGKSTFFKVMAGTWKYGAGEVSVPNAPEMCFLPQQPVIQRDTLKAVLAYPEPVDTYTNADYETVLRDVGGMEKFIERLDDSDNWSKILSGGQQQRISFARALIKKPNWLFLDESTASLDGQSEEEMYGLLKSRLNGTTFISIAHKDSVEKFHDRVITLDVGGPNNETRALETPRLSTGMG